MQIIVPNITIYLYLCMVLAENSEQKIILSKYIAWDTISALQMKINII